VLGRRLARDLSRSPSCGHYPSVFLPDRLHAGLRAAAGRSGAHIQEAPSMMESMRLAYYEIRDAYADGKLQTVIRKRVYRNRIATPTEIDPLAVPAFAGLAGSGLEFVELQLQDLRAGKWTFIEPSRQYKAPGNLRKGWRGFALVEGTTVLGDIWCVTPGPDGGAVTHPDLDFLGIRCGEREAYAFDVYIDTGHRGRNLAVPLMRSLHAVLGREGCTKVYGFYWDDNVRALWLHRVLKFKELPKRRVTRLFSLHSAETVAGSEKPSTNTISPTR
jgi:GNAT superfamily N-acetyltransferase